MSKVKFEVTKIHCQKETRGEWGRDEIYCVAIPVIGKTQDDTIDFHHIDPNKIAGRVLSGKVSTVQNRVKSGEAWKPTMEPIEIDTGDDTALCVLLVLFEEDNGKLRKELIEKFSKGSWPIDLPDELLPPARPGSTSTGKETHLVGVHPHIKRMVDKPAVQIKSSTIYVM
jgi:hypothetical protein